MLYTLYWRNMLVCLLWTETTWIMIQGLSAVTSTGFTCQQHNLIMKCFIKHTKTLQFVPDHSQNNKTHIHPSFVHLSFMHLLLFNTSVTLMHAYSLLIVYLATVVHVYRCRWHECNILNLLCLVIVQSCFCSIEPGQILASCTLYVQWKASDSIFYVFERKSDN